MFKAKKLLPPKDVYTLKRLKSAAWEFYDFESGVWLIPEKFTSGCLCLSKDKCEKRATTNKNSVVEHFELNIVERYSLVQSIKKVDVKQK